MTKFLLLNKGYFVVFSCTYLIMSLTCELLARGIACLAVNISAKVRSRQMVALTTELRQAHMNSLAVQCHVV